LALTDHFVGITEMIGTRRAISSASTKWSPSHFLQGPAAPTSQNVPPLHAVGRISLRVGRAHELLRIHGEDDGIVVVRHMLEERMSEERLERIEQKVDILVSGQIGLETRMGRVETRLDGIETRLDGIDGRLDGIDGRLDGIDGRLDGIDGRLDRTEGSQEDLRGMVMQIAEGHAAHTRQIALGFEALHMALERHQRPLEDAVRDHTAILKRNRIS